MGKALFSFAVARLKEPSSWAGLAAGAASVVTGLKSGDTAALAPLVFALAAILAPERNAGASKPPQ